MYRSASKSERLEVDTAIPFPEIAISEGLPGALWIIETDALFAPALFGTNVIVIAQFAPTATMLQSLDWVKSADADPVIEIELILRITLPELLTVIVCSALEALVA